MKFTRLLRHGNFTRRVNRFLASISIDGREEHARVPNSGRMGGLLTLGRPIRLWERSHQRRKTRYDLSLVHRNDHWVSIDARLPGILLAESIENGDFSGLTGYSLLKREVTYRSSRIDLLLGRGNGPCLVETKSVTLVNGGVARFPDAPTARGARHVLDLGESIGEGYEAWIVFVCQREDARLFSPNEPVDPRFAQALRMAYDRGLKVFAFNCRVTEEEITLKDRIPVVFRDQKLPHP